MQEKTVLGPLQSASVSTDEKLTGLLADVTQEFASSLNIEETLQNAIERFIVYLDAEAASIFLLEDNDSALVCRKCAGPVDVTGLRLTPKQGIVGQTVQENTAQIVREVSKNPDFASVVDHDTGFVTRSILCAPLSVRGRCIGALELLNKRSGDGLFDVGDMHLATAVASAAALGINNAHMAQALVEQERVRKELELAREIQVSLLPSAMAGDFPAHGLNIPAREVSGDFYDFLEVEDGRIYFSLADVSGKGMNAALLMAKTTSLLRCLAKTSHDPGQLLAQVNEEICETASMGMFVTIVAGFIHRREKMVKFANAGHQPPLFRHSKGGYREIPAESPPLGVLPGITFDTTELSIEDGALYLFTDGVTECVSPDKQPLEVDGLRRLIDAAGAVVPRARLQNIVAELRKSGYRFHDDITLLLIEIGQRD